ncbi:MAG: AMP-binding protein, partial [SAR324 cluster bacterium]|nr:AMP-binding protein [SAR324 cluster bacterium]
LVNSPPGPYDRNHKVDRILGNGLRPDIWEVFRKRFGVEHIREFYASTEGNAATLNMNDVVASVGKPVLTDNLAVLRFDVEKEEYLRDDAGFCIRCDSGEVGALVGGISAALPFSGYTNSEETEKKLLRDVFKAGDSYFKTGDLLKKDADGNYFFVDRIGDTFRWKGENVSTHEVAEIISTFPGVSFVTVFGVEVPATEGRVGMAAVTMEKENAFDPQAFYRFTEDQLPGYSRPAFLRLKPELEVTGTFKLLKVDLKHTGYNPELVSDELFFRQGETKNYVPLDKALFDRIQSGSLRL